MLVFCLHSKQKEKWLYICETGTVIHLVDNRMYFNYVCIYIFVTLNRLLHALISADVAAIRLNIC